LDPSETAVFSDPNHSLESNRFPVARAPPFMHRDPRDGALDDPRRYEQALALLRERHAKNGGLEQTGLALDELVASSDPALAKKLAPRVADGSYAFSPVTERRAFLGGKWRHVYRAPLADTVVLFVLARELTALVAPLVSERVYSYQKGRSSRQAVRDLARFVRSHRAGVPDVRARGLHVLRRDVSGYGDSIPVGEASPLWPLLRRAFERAGHAAQDPFASLVERALRPRVLRLDGTLEQAARGVPMGSPLQPAICNLYLDALDRRLAPIAGGFYARFGDDFVFAHADVEVARRASDAVTAALAELDLTLNAEKVRDLFWSGAGRHPAAPVSARERGTTHVEYLGARLAFDGTTTPSERKLRRLRSELRARIAASEQVLRDTPLDARVGALVLAVNHALDPRHDAALIDAVELFVDGSDRKKLAELDHWLARTLAEALSGRRGVRALRSAPPRYLRRHGLLSLVARRRRQNTT
jgi:hypothetical protein